MASLFAERGATVIDVDLLGRLVLEPGGRAHGGVIEAFGTGILADDGVTIDRAKLAPIVFGDPADLARLEAISHPAINAELDERLVAAAAAGDEWVVLDMAVLVESSLGQHLPSGHSYDTVVVVEAPESVRIERLVETRGMSVDDATARMASQTSDAERRAVADVVVVNDGDLAALRNAIDAALPQLRG